MRVKLLVFGVLVMVLGITGITIGFIAFRFSDPQPEYALVEVEEPPDTAQWRMIKGAPLADLVIDGSAIRATAGNSDVQMLIAAPEAFTSTSSVAIAIQQIDGPTDAGYGLWWGTSSDNYLAAAINSEHYVLVTDVSIDFTEAIMPWQSYPHIRDMGTENQLRADITNQRTTLWLNDEVVKKIDRHWDAEKLIGGVFLQLYAGQSMELRINSFRVWRGQ